MANDINKVQFERFTLPFVETFHIHMFRCATVLDQLLVHLFTPRIDSQETVQSIKIKFVWKSFYKKLKSIHEESIERHFLVFRTCWSCFLISNQKADSEGSYAVRYMRKQSGLLKTILYICYDNICAKILQRNKKNSQSK